MKHIFTIFLISFSGIAFLTSCQSNNNKNTQEEAVSETSHISAQPRTSHFNTIIATINDKNYTLAEDINPRISNWTEIINKGISSKISFSNVKIDKENNDYFLIGIDESANLTSKIRLIRVDNHLFEYLYHSESQNTEAWGEAGTCSGCSKTSESSNNCQPMYDDGDWYCTNCPDGTCVKTVSANTGGIISN